jgi:hypothetical protein
MLGESQMRLRGPRSASFGVAIEFHFFGDTDHLRHVRALIDTEDRQVAEACVDLNIQTWVAALETVAMLETRRPFHVARLPGPQTFAVGIGQGGPDTRALVIIPQASAASPLDYERVVRGFSVWNGDVRHHLFYFRRLIDESLPLDVRWLNGYRLLEWNFVSDRGGLARSQEWRAFVARFENQLLPLARHGQRPIGLLEEARALAAHAGLDERDDDKRRRDPRNAMEKTFRVLERMVMTALNEHPARAGHPVRFEPQP